MTDSNDGRRPIVSAPGSHLYRGVTVRMSTRDDVDPVRERMRPADLLFGDGSHTAAQLMSDDRGRLTLWVQAYVTERGTEIPERVWSVTVLEEDTPGGTATLRLGSRLP
ncbi:hypothetical protein [Streptomyces sp. SID3343]|uniref:hypothetical protein n=1 Tax=Streptomyces sp. SID3343 TaxID=2690260 RepID=UPI00136ECDBA|nr:hypothetical protein [Streptomyces sp. SID3343]MYW00532.1 hypothetical protein [Streptomyces sp. SID3343]